MFNLIFKGVGGYLGKRGKEYLNAPICKFYTFSRQNSEHFYITCCSTTSCY